MFPDHFDTARLRAERLRTDHLAALCRMDRNPGFMAHLGGVRDEAGTAAYLARNLQHWEQFGHGLWVLCDRADGRIIGRGVLRHLVLDGVDDVELGYGFYPEYWGRGLATEIAWAFVGYGRDALGCASLVALTQRDHVASQRVMIKVGMEFERDLTVQDRPHVLYRTRPFARP